MPVLVLVQEVVLWIFFIMITITSTTITEYGISSVAAKTPPLESSNTRNTIDHLLSQIQTWQQIHHEQQLLHENHPPSSQSTTATSRRPFVTAAFAQSIDGYMSPLISQSDISTTINLKNGTEQCTQTHSNYPLSCPESFILTHGLRSIHDGILIGGRTLLLDNPRLTNRLWGRNSDSTNRILPSSNHSHYYHQPQPIIIDPNLRYITQLLNTTTSNGVMNVQHPIVCCTDHAASSNQLHQYSYFQVQDQEQGQHGLYFRNSITNNTIRLLPCQCHNDTTRIFNMTHVFHQLYHQYHIRSIMVEGGASTLSTLLTSRMVDAIVITIAPLLFGHGIRPRFRPFVDPTRKQTNHFDALRLIPSSTSFVLLGKDTTFIARCDQS